MISHVCFECGLDIARCRPRKEPVYGLPLVTCPRCAAPALRRPHPVAERSGKAAAITGAIVVLLVQTTLLAAIVAATTGACIGLTQLPRNLHAGDLAGVIGLAVVVLPLAIGGWIGATLPHWRRSVVLGLLAAIVALLLALDTIVLPRLATALDAAGIDVIRPAYEPKEWRRRMVVLVAIAAVSVAGMPAGALARAVSVRAIIAARRAMRRRQRARRIVA